MNRFHNTHFGGRALVCRLQRSSGNSNKLQEAPSPDTPTVLTGSPTTFSSDSPLLVSSTSPGTGFNESSRSATTVQSTSTFNKETPTTDETEPIESPSLQIPARFFILKSLTLADLEASRRTGTWSTQQQNESTLKQAYGEAKNVYLFFSANKSGEYMEWPECRLRFGADKIKSHWTVRTPRTQPTFHESLNRRQRRPHLRQNHRRLGSRHALLECVEAEEDDNDTGGSGDSEKEFSIEWISTTRLPFCHTRGLRNDWNQGRERKIARDGTELDPRVGRRLMQLFGAYGLSGRLPNCRSK